MDVIVEVQDRSTILIKQPESGNEVSLNDFAHDG